MPNTPTAQESRSTNANSAARLYALWLVSSLFILLVALGTFMLSFTRWQDAARQAAEQRAAADALRQDLDALNARLARLESAALNATAAPRPRPESEPARPTIAPGPSRSIAPAPAPALSSSAPEAKPDAAKKEPAPVDALLARALVNLDTDDFELADAAAAEQALRLGVNDAYNASWDGRTWARLALAARLLDREGPADAFAQKADALGVFPREFYLASVRSLLTKGQATAAQVYANRLATQLPNDPLVQLARAEVYRSIGDCAAAADALDKIANPDALSVSARLRLGRLLIDLEDWPRFLAVTRSILSAPPQLMYELNFLRAVAAAREQRFPEALAILDDLAAIEPGDYDVQTWRGIVLYMAGEPDVARQALAIAEQFPQRPDAWHWLGILSLEQGDLDAAAKLFQNALNAAQSYAPAWEALGMLAEHQNDLPSALNSYQNAARANPRRASSHFLLAGVQAQMMQHDACFAELREALRLDPTLTERVKQRDEFRRLLTTNELNDLLRATPPKQIGARAAAKRLIRHPGRTTPTRAFNR